MIWLEFILCVVLIVITGSRLSRYGDILAKRTGMGRTWIGLILLATVTSLPELGTGVSAITLVSAPDLAVGALLGSCVFNLMLIGLFDMNCKPQTIFGRLKTGQVISGGFGILMIGIVAWGLIFEKLFSRFTIGWLGPYTLLILFFFIIAARMLFRFEQKTNSSSSPEEVEFSHFKTISTNKVYLYLVLNSIGVVGAGTWLAFIGREIAQVTGWGETFVGNLLVGASTSLPEIVTSVAALRLGAPNLAVSNLLGSNLFNIAILGIEDLIYLKGPILTVVSFQLLFSAITAIVMTVVAIIAMIYRSLIPSNRFFRLEGIGLIFLFLINSYLLFSLGSE